MTYLPQMWVFGVICMHEKLFPPLKGVCMSLGLCAACGLSVVVDLAWPSCIISLLNHVECVSGWLGCSLSLFISHSLFDFSHTCKISHCQNLNKSSLLLSAEHTAVCLCTTLKSTTFLSLDSSLFRKIHVLPKTVGRYPCLSVGIQ